jgi:2-keto-myo-inositol isomerase
MKPCISQASCMPSPFLEDIEGFVAGGLNAIEVWLTKLEDAIAQIPPRDLKARVDDRGVTLVAASYQGGLLLSQGEARKVHVDHFKRRLELCELFQIPTLLIVADYARSVDAEGLERSIKALREAALWSEGFGVRLALEFRGTDAFCSNLETALFLVEECGEKNVGINFDVFHYYKGPSKLEDLARLTRDRLAFVQVCDVAGVPREIMTDSDRILPGDGDFQLGPIFRRFHEIGYDGWVSLEVMNPVFWQAKPSQVAELGGAALRRFMELA